MAINNKIQKDDNLEQNGNRDQVNKLTREFIDKHELFHDNLKQPWIAISKTGSKVMSLKGEEFRHWVMKETIDEKGNFLSAHAVDEIARRLIAMALFNDDQPKSLGVRVAQESDDDGLPKEFWYDLCDKDGLAVHITRDGYKIEGPPVLFRRYSYQYEQIRPSAKVGGKLDDIFEIVNLTERDDKVVFVVFLISCFVAQFPKPILLITGTNGSGKSTPCRILHSLIDPGPLESGTAIVRDTLELARQANKLCLLHFDNIDGREVSPEISNALCRITSGQSFMRRTMFEDDGDTIFEGQRPIIMNGIGRLVEREDILDRSIIISMKRIPEDRRKTEASIFARFAGMKPYLLHEIFTTLSKVITILPTVNIKRHHRLADFDQLGYAICEALDGYSGEEWLDIYDRVVKRQVENALEESATAQLAKYLVDRSNYHIWEGTATDMFNFKLREDDVYKKTQEDISIEQTIKSHPSFPKNASALGTQLNRAESTLQALGITVEHSKGKRNNYKNRTRWITLRDYGWAKSHGEPATRPAEDDKYVCPF